MKDTYLPELHNPMNDIMLNGMTGLPRIIAEAMPVLIPQMQYNQNPVSMIFGNYKRKKIAEAYALEANIAEDSTRRVKASMEGVHAIITCSSRVQDTLGMYEHNKIMRNLEAQEKQADIYIKQAHAQQMGFEAKLSELDYNIKLKQHQEIMGG